jgi:hypothetical protein
MTGRRWDGPLRLKKSLKQKNFLLTGPNKKL